MRRIGRHAAALVLRCHSPPASLCPSSQVAFLPQDDALLPTLTVAECLLMHAMLRLPASLTPQQAQVGGKGGVWPMQPFDQSRPCSPCCMPCQARCNCTEAQPPMLQSKVAAVIAELGLQQVAGSRVGSTGTGRRGISGGERRR